MEKKQSLVYPGFSYREEEVCKIVQALFRGKASVGVFCIQECSTKMARLLEKTLEPLKIAVIVGDGGRNNHVVTMVDLEVYTVLDVKIKPIFQRYIREKGEWFWDQWRPAVDLVVEKRFCPFGKPNRFRIVNLHISSAGQTDDYKTDRLQEVREYLEQSPTAMNLDIITGDFNACKSLADPVFKKESYKSLCSHHSQIENIVPVKGAKNGAVEGPHMVSIDDLILRMPEDAKLYHAAFPMHPKETSDFKASQMLETVFDPLLANRRKLI
jgi:exonuclease III